MAISTRLAIGDVGTACAGASPDVTALAALGPPPDADAASELLQPMLEEWPDLLGLVFAHLDPTDCALLSLVGRPWMASVVSRGLARAGDGAAVPLNLRSFVASVKMLAWAKENGCSWNATTCALAAEGGHLEVLQWARQHGCEWNSTTCLYAALGGHLEVLQWAREHGCDWSVGVCRGAAEGGHLGLLQWAREHHCPWDWLTCAGAAQHGHLEVLKWALERGCLESTGTNDLCALLYTLQVSATLCARAALGGQLEVLRWLRGHYYSWDALTCEKAAQGGHLETLKWLREHQCPWDANTLLQASLFGHADVLQWALDNGCPDHL